MRGCNDMNKKNRNLWEDIKTFIIFCGPITFIFTTVIIIPAIFGIYLTFTNWDGISKAYSFAGVSNFAALFTDVEFWKSFALTLKFVFFATILTNVLAFFLAYALVSGIKGQNFLRAGFFTPNLIGGVILGIIWNFIFSNIFTFIGNKYGIGSMMMSMLSKPNTAFFAMVLVTVWQYSGYMMIIYIAGFMNVPKDIIEAANIDGVTPRKRLSKIVMPLMVPSFIICIFLTLQRCFMTYDVNLTLTKGGPFGSTKLISMHVYEKAFLSQKYGVGQAEAFFLFLVVALVTVTQLYFSKKMEVEA